MRSSKFTFKKTKKVTTEHRGVCLDLTEEEAKDLLCLAEWRAGHGGWKQGVGDMCRDLVKHINACLDEGVLPF